MGTDFSVFFNERSCQSQCVRHDCRVKLGSVGPEESPDDPHFLFCVTEGEPCWNQVRTTFGLGTFWGVSESSDALQSGRPASTTIQITTDVCNRTTIKGYERRYNPTVKCSPTATASGTYWDDRHISKLPSTPSGSCLGHIQPQSDSWVAAPKNLHSRGKKKRLIVVPTLLNRPSERGRTREPIKNNCMKI